MQMICEGMVSTSSAENRMLFEEEEEYYGEEEEEMDQRSLGEILQEEIKGEKLYEESTNKVNETPQESQQLDGSPDLYTTACTTPNLSSIDEA